MSKNLAIGRKFGKPRNFNSKIGGRNEKIILKSTTRV